MVAAIDRAFAVVDQALPEAYGCNRSSAIVRKPLKTVSVR